MVVAAAAAELVVVVVLVTIVILKLGEIALASGVQRSRLFRQGDSPLFEQSGLALEVLDALPKGPSHETVQVAHHYECFRERVAATCMFERGRRGRRRRRL